MAESMRPPPSASPDGRPYWEAARRHELVLPYCRMCENVEVVFEDVNSEITIPKFRPAQSAP